MVMSLTFCRGELDRRPRPREALVIYGQPVEARKVTDDQGIDFLSFPWEIRDIIYSFIFVKPTFIGADTKFTKPFYKDAISWRHLDFAGSCRQIWNESLRVYLVKNGFEFFYIRPFLEFLEKIGIRGRRLLKNIRWHHHKRIEFGTALGFGNRAEVNEEPPDFGAMKAFGVFETRSLATLSENLKKVKWEVSGNYKRPDLPSILVNGMCHWKYKMIDEKKQQKKAEMNRQKEEAQAKSQGDGSVEASSEAQDPDANVEHENGDGDDEMIDGDDGYVIQDGNLMKDGIVVANGAVFETGGLLEDERQVEDSAGDVVIGNGDNADMILDDEIYVAADDRPVDDDKATDDDTVENGTKAMDVDTAVDGGMAVENEMML